MSWLTPNHLTEGRTIRKTLHLCDLCAALYRGPEITEIACCAESRSLPWTHTDNVSAQRRMTRAPVTRAVTGPMPVHVALTGMLWYGDVQQSSW